MKAIDRVIQYIDFKDVKPSVFEKRIALSNGYIGTQKKRNGSLGEDVLKKILDNCLDINPIWLLTGNGEMLLDEVKKENSTIVENTSVVNNIPTLPIIPAISENKGVPYYDVDFIGGFDLVANNQTIQPNFFIDFAPFNDADYWVNISGKSMSPFISHGDMVALKRFDSWQDFILYGEIYAIVTDDFRTIKIVGKGEDKEHLSLIPYSKSREFSEQDIPKRLIKHMFKVKGSIKKFF
ncbi:MAG: S24 family peptidase [Flavobacteriales bacterium]